MGMDIEGLEQVKLLLKRMNGAVDVASAELKMMANEVAETAKHMAPIDYGDLQSAIKVKVEREHGANGRFVKGGVSYAVYIDNDQPVQDPFKQKYGVETVGEYAWIVYQYMGYGHVQGYLDGKSFNPSEKSVNEGLKYGVEAGGLFLERAAVEKTHDIQERLAMIVRKYMESPTSVDMEE